MKSKFIISKKLKSKKKILCFVEYYVPSYKWGGPVHAIKNFVDQLNNEFNIYIVCRDRDYGDKASFKNIKINEWNKVGKVMVLYASPKNVNFMGFYKLMRDVQYDILYLNSFFSKYFSILPLFIQYLKFTSSSTCILSPRGEFSPNALKLKKLKKLLFIMFTKLVGLHDNVRWLASSKYEYYDIKKIFDKFKKKIYIARDLVSNLVLPNIKQATKKKIKIFKIVFLSRITPMKNLDYLLKVLKGLKKVSLQLAIYGTIEDKKYWKYCKLLISELPKNIKVIFFNKVKPEKVLTVFSKYDLFTFPTRGENFGYVITESLSAGTPILLSDKTLWKNDKKFGIEIVPLDIKKWVDAIQKWANLSRYELMKRRKAAHHYAKKNIFLVNKKTLIQTKKIFNNLKKIN